MSFKVNSKVVWNGGDALSQFDKAQGIALEISSILVQNAAVKNAPKDTGALKASITRAVDGLVAIVGTVLSYASLVEFGTRFQAAQPYLRPALFLNEKKIINIFKKANKAVKYVD